MFKYTLDNKRYHTLNYFYRTKFNNKVFKVPLDAHMSCPNKFIVVIIVNLTLLIAIFLLKNNF